MRAFIALILIAVYSCKGLKLSNCQKDQIKFEKVVGLRPSNSFRPLLLIENTDGTPITIDCIRKCYENDECQSFVLYYKNSSCFWFRSEVHDFQEEDSVYDMEVSWFKKVCLKEQRKCNRSWTFERVSGATLIGNDTKRLPSPVTREDCQQYCLNETTFECRSAKFKIRNNNNVVYNYYRAPSTDLETVGSCILSNSDRLLSPNSYRVSSFDEEYFENQCSPEIKNAFCAFEEYEHVALSHVDAVRYNYTKMQCEDECNANKNFRCRGYSIVATNKINFNQQRFTCLIYSENSKLHGPKMLRERQGATYYEKAPCLNISVSCTQKSMTIQFQPEVSFNGKLYMKDYSENRECYALGNYTNLITLEIPLILHNCGVGQANSSLNRTLMYSTMILQYNALVQTQADRIIKVGCIFANSTKVVVGAGFNFTDDHSASGSSIVNMTTTLPTVEMRILDLNTQGEISDTQIGEELQLIIEMKPANNGLDIWAGHLVAMTENGQDSILLLDDRGCPTNLDVFPGLIKQVTNTSIKLTSTFQAFKFSSSNIIRFSVIVQFCAKTCPPMNCGGNAFYNRQRRGVAQEGNIKPINRTQFQEEGMKVVEKMPLELVLVVRSTNIRPDKLVYGENNKILIAGYDYLNNEVCIDYSVLLGIVVTWILIQVILLVSCIILIRKYKRYYENQSLSESLEELHKNFGLGFSNLEPGRRVHFADGHLT